jgi:hypothetical protein
MVSIDYNLLTKQKDLFSFAPVIVFIKNEFPFGLQEQLINDTDKSQDSRRYSQ